jgi:hypothetical protein
MPLLILNSRKKITPSYLYPPIGEINTNPLASFSFSASIYSYRPAGVSFSYDGSRMIISPYSYSATSTAWNLSTSWDITTAGSSVSLAESYHYSYSGQFAKNGLSYYYAIFQHAIAVDQYISSVPYNFSEASR